MTGLSAYSLKAILDAFPDVAVLLGYHPRYEVEPLIEEVELLKAKIAELRRCGDESSL